jgi:hypothetical protein
MSGLNLGVGGGLRFGGAGSTVASAPPATIQQVAQGTGATQSRNSGFQSGHLGVSVGVSGLIWLCFIRWTLPG